MPRAVRKAVASVERGQGSIPATRWADRIVIPHWHPARVNELVRNWRKAMRLKKADRSTVAAYWWRMAGVKASGKRRVTLSIHRKPKCRGGDADAYWKSTLDALVACGALVDDKHQWCELAPVRFPERSEWWGTEILLEDIA